MKSAKSRSLGTARGEMNAEAQDGPEEAFVGAKVHSEYLAFRQRLLALIPSPTELTQSAWAARDSVT